MMVVLIFGVLCGLLFGVIVLVISCVYVFASSRMFCLSVLMSVDIVFGDMCRCLWWNFWVMNEVLLVFEVILG